MFSCGKLQTVPVHLAGEAKGVKAQVMGEELRVTSTSRDDLQAVITGLKDIDLEIPLQFNNFRD